MLKRFKVEVIIIYVALLPFSYIFALDILAEEQAVIWQSGPYIHFKYVAQDTDADKNEHPATLDARDLSQALAALKIWDKGLLSRDAELKPVFSSQQIRLLGQYLAEGLEKASPGQDIIFVLERELHQALGFRRNVFITGRAFYKDDRLNIILGSYNMPRNDAFERAYDPSGQIRIPYAFKYGSRLKNVSRFNKELGKIPGIENKKIKELRRDWFLVDIKRAAAAKRKSAVSAQSAGDATIEQQSAAAKERRAMRVEMARMRKAMRDFARQSGQKKSVEERMLILDALREKKLINQQEYDRKRQAILNEI